MWLTHHVVFLGPWFSCESWTRREKSSTKEKPRGLALSSRKREYSLPRRMLMSRLPLKMVHPWSICAEVTESMVFVFFSSSHTLGQGPSQGMQYMLLKIKPPNTLRAESVFLHQKKSQKMCSYSRCLYVRITESNWQKHSSGHTVSHSQAFPGVSHSNGNAKEKLTTKEKRAACFQTKHMIHP